MITHVIVELKYPVEDKYFIIDTVFPNEYYGYGTPLIRCKDCHWHYGTICRKNNTMFWYDDDFCSEAEREEYETN